MPTPKNTLQHLVSSGRTFTAAEAERQEISQRMLSNYTKTNKLERLRAGMYVDYDVLDDPFVILQARQPKGIFSSVTALGLYDLSGIQFYNYHMTSVSQRTTTDIDFTLIGITDDESQQSEILKKVFSRPTDDKISSMDFHFSQIRQDAIYPGIRVTGRAEFDGTWAKAKFDITTDDAIFGGPIDFKHHDIVNCQEIVLRAYSAEQMQTIYGKGRLSTRVKDLYDIALLTSDRAIKPVDYAIVHSAFNEVSKCKHTSIDSHEIAEALKDISGSAFIQEQWVRFSNNEGRNYIGQIDLKRALDSVWETFRKANITGDSEQE